MIMALPAAFLFLSSVAGAQYLDPHCNGKQAIVQLFEWKWSDIAEECERYLGPKAFCGVQISPPNEHVMITIPPAPWYERYQAVSYKLLSRGGNETEFADMVKRCNAVNVRIIVDVVINHMTRTDNSGQGSGGSQYDGPSLSYPGVPYTAPNFNSRMNCPSKNGEVSDYGDPSNVRNCNLVGLSDLDQGQEYVRQKIVDYLDHLLDLGVAGFRVADSKHMWPKDLATIQAATKDTQFGGRPFYIHEVVDMNDGAVKVSEYYDLGRVTEFRYSKTIAAGVANFSHIQEVADYGWGMADSDHALIFVDNQDNQREHGGGTGYQRVYTHVEPGNYALASAFTLAWNYGFPRVMSSYSFEDPEQGPPHNADYSTADVTINSDGSCGGGWVCEHRWPTIGNMAAFRNAVVGTDVRNFKQIQRLIGFARGNKGFFAMAKGGFDVTFSTGLPAGEYCELISECRTNVTVDASGNARLSPERWQDPVVAFVVGPEEPESSKALARFADYVFKTYIADTQADFRKAFGLKTTFMQKGPQMCANPSIAT